jgi:hypothetical protein
MEYLPPGGCVRILIRPQLHYAVWVTTWTMIWGKGPVPIDHEELTGLMLLNLQYLIQ